MPFDESTPPNGESPQYLEHVNDPTHPAGNEELAENMAHAGKDYRDEAASLRQEAAESDAKSKELSPSMGVLGNTPADDEAFDLKLDSEGKSWDAARLDEKASEEDGTEEQARVEYLRAHPELAQDSESEGRPALSEEDKLLDPTEELSAVSPEQPNEHQSDESSEDGSETSEHVEVDYPAGSNEALKDKMTYEAKTVSQSTEDNSEDSHEDEESENKSAEQLEEDLKQAKEAWRALREDEDDLEKYCGDADKVKNIYAKNDLEDYRTEANEAVKQYQDAIDKALSTLRGKAQSYAYHVLRLEEQIEKARSGGEH